MLAPIRLVCLLCAAPALSACAPMLSLLGTNQTAVQIVAQLERVKLAGDGASFAASHKTLTDHLLSRATGKDCVVFNILTGESVCTDQTQIVAADSDTPPNAVATPESPATPPTQVTATPSPAVIEFSNEQASGD